MKLPLIAAIILTVVPLLPGDTLDYPEMEAARATAEMEKKPVLVFWHGSDRMNDRDSYYAEWSKLKSMELPVVLAQFDEKTDTGSDAYKKHLPYRAYNLPVVMLLTADGTPMATLSGKTIRSAASLKAAVTKLLPNAPRFEELVARGIQTQGVEGARLLGQALDLLRENDALNCDKIISQIRQKDPWDETGYVLRYGTDHIVMYKKINEILSGGEQKLKGENRDFDAAGKCVDEVLAQNELSPLRKQQWTAAKAYIESERLKSLKKYDDREARKALVLLYRSIVKIDPESEYGKGAAVYAHYWDPDTFMTVEGGFYDTQHQTRNFEKDWHVDVTKQITKPGLYRFSLEPLLNGKLITRNFRLAINGKEVAQAGNDPQEDTKSVTIRIPSKGKIRKAEIWLTAECRDGWLESSGNIRMERIGD